MIKIGKPHEGEKIQKGLKAATSPQTDLKSKRGSERIGKILSPSGQKPAITRQEMLQTALKTLAYNKISLPGKSLPALRSLLSLIRQSQPVPGSSDLILAEVYLGRWIDTYGTHLPEEVKKELVLLKQYLQGERQESIQKSDILHYQEGLSALGDDSPFRFLAVYREKGDHEEKEDHLLREEEESLSCVLDMDFPRLGPVKVVLKQNEKKGSCSFYSRGSAVRRLISRSLNLLSKRILEADLSVPVWKVKARFPALNHKVEKRKGVGLWG